MFYPLEKLHLLQEGYQRVFRVANQEILLLHNEGRTYLVGNRCPHMDAPLTRASVQQGVIRCPMHGLEFDLRSGQPRHPACQTPLKTYMPAYEGNVLGVVL